jgi:predicted nucleic acid-binding protein
VNGTIPEIVLDASAAMRGLVGAGWTAVDVVDGVVSGRTVANAPELIIAEVANALRVAIHPERWSVQDARERLETFLDWPMAIQPCRPLAAAALETAAELDLSCYDAFYAVVSSQLGVPLVTADRKLAAAVPGAVLVT